MKEYNHKAIEEKWRKYWQEKKIYETEKEQNNPKCYVLDMFPYPSGEGLHVGHPKGYIATDVYSRYKKMKGFNVLHPMGWDAFGLPAENYAIKNKVHPKKAVLKNIKRYKEQLSILGFNYDWDREINTTDPEYYRWTQWIFLQMFKKGRAYQSYEPINWCPSCKTGLANEDLEDGRCERCGSEVLQKPVRQWVLKITDYADRLLEDIENLDWPESIKESQRNWIGRSEGAEIEFGIKNYQSGVKVFTTRSDTIFGATYLVISPEHKILEKLQENKELGIKNYEEIQKYINQAKKKTEIERVTEGKEKTGVELKGVKAVNPATGEEIPVWVADYVLPHYGTGSIMAVPAHDERDFQFAKKFNLPIRQVVAPYVVDSVNPPVAGKKNTKREMVHCIVEHSKEKKIISLKWEKQDWQTFITGGVEEGEDLIEAAKREVYEETGYKNLEFIKKLPFKIRADFYTAHKDVNREVMANFVYFKLKNEDKDEISEKEKELHRIQWIGFDEIKTLSPVSELEFVLKWLENDDDVFTGEGLLINSGKFDGLSSEEAKREITSFVKGKKKTTYKLRDWVFSRQRYWGEPIPLIHCDNCGVVSVPEEDLPVTLPEVNHYQPTGTGESPLSSIKEWVNAPCPKCGEEGKRETNTMPQWAGSCWYYLRYMDPKNSERLVDLKKEKYWSPVDVYIGGSEHATRHLIYARFWHKFLFDIGIASTEEPFKKYNFVGLIQASDGKKMSKRYGNVINPDEVVEEWGADTLRIYEMFMGPFDQTISWSTKNMAGSRRFLEKVWRLQEKVLKDKTPESDKDLDVLTNDTIKKVSNDIESFDFNTAISALMIFVNRLEEEKEIIEERYKTLLKLLTPFAPHITEELWSRIYSPEEKESQNVKSIYQEKWPEYKSELEGNRNLTIAVQVNGKVRDSIDIIQSSEENQVKKQALALENVKKWVKDKNIKKIIYVKGKIINIVTD